MLSNDLRLELQNILERGETIKHGGYAMRVSPKGQEMTRKKTVWGAPSGVKTKEPSPVQKAAIASRSKLIQKSLARRVAAQQKPSKVVPFPIARPVTAQPTRRVVTASVILTRYLEDIINDQYDISGETQAMASLRKAGIDPDLEKKILKKRQKLIRRQPKSTEKYRAAIKLK